MTVQVIGVVPAATSWRSTGVPTTNVGSAGVEIVGAVGAARTVPEYVAGELPTLLVAVIVTEYGPAVVGVPASRPAVSIVTPAGSAPAVTVQVIGVVPAATSWTFTGVPTVNVGSAGVEIVGAVGTTGATYVAVSASSFQPVTPVPVVVLPGRTTPTIRLSADTAVSNSYSIVTVFCAGSTPGFRAAMIDDWVSQLAPMVGFPLSRTIIGSAVPAL